MSYRTRLTLLTCAAISVTLLAAIFITYTLARTGAYTQIDEGLEGRIELTRALQQIDEERSEGDEPAPPNPRIPGIGPGAPGGFTRVLDRDGDIVVPGREQPREGAGSGDPAAPRRIDPARLPARVRAQFQQIDVALPVTSAAKALAGRESRSLLYETIQVDGGTYRIVTARVGAAHTVQAARPITETQEFLRRLALLLLAVTGGGIAVGVAAALVVTRAASAPVHRLTELTRSVRDSGDLSKRIETTGDDDLGRLAQSVNTMLEEIERTAIRHQQLVDDASHQLRTPLASIRTNIDVLQRTTDLDGDVATDILRDLSAQTDELTGLVRDLVDLAATLESDVDRVPVQLDEVVIEAIQRVRGSFDRITFTPHLAPLVVNGSSERLVRMVQNLLHNAGKWSPADSDVSVHLSGDEIRVVDHGSGVPAAERERIFERFHRAPDVRDVPGSGLGLAIVQQVATDHGGSARVEETPGGGATFIVTLPVVDAG